MNQTETELARVFVCVWVRVFSVCAQTWGASYKPGTQKPFMFAKITHKLWTKDGK